MDEQDYTILDNYFNGLLSEEDQQMVLQRTALEPAFAKEFGLRQSMETWLGAEPKRAEVRQLTNELGASFFETDTAKPALQVVHKRRPMVRILLLAAASVALLVAALWIFSPKEDLYAAYSKHAPLELTVRGAQDADKTTAERAFQQKDFAKALSALQQLNAADNQPIYQLYVGICLIELNRSAEARAMLQPIATGQSAFKGEAVWYQALSYLREGKEAAAGDLLRTIAPTDSRYRQAKELMGKM
jgi:tetratricopeptide (TPR) repeat protein